MGLCGNVAGVGAGCGPVAGIVEEKHCCPGENSFLLLLLLFILLASCVTKGITNNFFFIIILAVIAFGGFGRTFFGEFF
ncbi:hypothetical protein [Lutispora saccharofermentans]|uniref:Transmembrane protein n=1 Tax=Lutispora saccharofermentans TaxID=3024236 RepID=A0ABT1NFG5_9FIRM|nr:hypothetical protein [Lutispora saccharofermentans]MCQ1530007.1 hypothetical protein [Lutispora saccharofermentans]